jgi:hypothetical protein
MAQERSRNMYSPLDLSMQHRLRWLEHFDSLNKHGFISKDFPEVGDRDPDFLLDDQDFVIKMQHAIMWKAARSDAHFYIEKSIQDLVTLAERSFPENVAFDMGWMRSQSGWLELAEPIHTRNGDSQIIGWIRETSVEGDDLFLFRFLPRTPSELKPPYLSVGCFMIQGRLLNDLRERDKKHPDPSPYEDRFLYTLMHILSQRIALPISETVRHNIRGQAVARGIDAVNRAKIIVLRRAEQYRREGHGSWHEYHCRFLVGGHWRQQPYPSESVVRSIFIESYIKGPADKPLKQPSAKIFVARR